ncbi:PaaX family transcriptional regulator C-terminal domain-containing protein [Streptomyces sp. NPDC053367]|uniref:PaaX family transcriptional regulator C-terminal domain-containing protein n=1 Tax=Streptomyces sp. NPDC053367 TaxID=3365700 RepID=UPI0037CE580D
MTAPDALDLRPLSARSVVLSLLLGADPPEMAAKDLARAVAPFDVGGSTLRAALSRMTAAGDLCRTSSGYRIGERLLERRRRQDDAVRPRTRAWGGDWEMVVVTATGREPAERAELRTRLSGLRLAELREGVWLRPANLARELPDDLGQVAQRYTSRPARPPRELAASLWPLWTWGDTAEALLAHVARVERPADRLTAYAAVVRHLLADPVLPDELLPADWPGTALRGAYASYRRELEVQVHRTPGTGSPCARRRCGS